MRPSLTDTAADDIGKACKEAEAGNMLVRSFAAELIGESYPLPKAMAEVVFRNWEDATLGRRFVEWSNQTDDARI